MPSAPATVQRAGTRQLFAQPVYIAYLTQCAQALPSYLQPNALIQHQTTQRWHGVGMLMKSQRPRGKNPRKHHVRYRTYFLSLKDGNELRHSGGSTNVRESEQTRITHLYCRVIQ